MAVMFPVIGQWFRRANGTLFEVVAIDEAAGTVELQQFDGTIDEIDMESWPELLLTEISAPRRLVGFRSTWTPKTTPARAAAKCRRDTTTRWRFWINCKDPLTGPYMLSGPDT